MTIWIAPLATVIAALIALVAATKIVSRTKISEFRQAWINDLREDTADYIGKAELWFRGWQGQNRLARERGVADESRLSLIEDIDLLSNEARVILWRIRLRFNPRSNKFKADDDRFLQSLLDLLDPGKINPQRPDLEWRRLADDAIAQGREILKREWEVAKGRA